MKQCLILSLVALRLLGPTAMAWGAGGAAPAPGFAPPTGGGLQAVDHNVGTGSGAKPSGLWAPEGAPAPRRGRRYGAGLRDSVASEHTWKDPSQGSLCPGWRSWSRAGACTSIRTGHGTCTTRQPTCGGSTPHRWPLSGLAPGVLRCLPSRETGRLRWHDFRHRPCPPHPGARHPSAAQPQPYCQRRPGFAPDRYERSSGCAITSGPHCGCDRARLAAGHCIRHAAVL